MDLEEQPSIGGKRLQRFVGERATVDLVIPDHLPKSTSTRIRGYEAVAIVGGQRALDRAGVVKTIAGRKQIDIVVPDLRGALVLKARAAVGDRRDNERHLTDVAFLCSLVADPLKLSGALDAKERASLRRVELSNDPRNPPWVFLEETARLNAIETWRVLTRQ